MTALDKFIEEYESKTGRTMGSVHAELAALRKVAEAVQRMKEKLDEHGFMGIVLAITELDEITKRA